MATERKSPDVLIVQDNLTGAVAAIQDDPDSPDANWLTYIANNVNTVTRVSFPTPTGNPTVGADLQQFKIWVRKQNGTGTPTITMEIWENGVSKAVILAATNVTSTTGQLFSATWNANLLGTANGSLVELYILGTAVGGAPATRCTVEIGAVEWNVTYDAAPSDFVYTGDGQTVWAGTALQKYSVNLSYIGDGIFNYSGSALYTLGFSFVGNGQCLYSGSALHSFGLSYIGNGVFNYSGSAIQKYSVNLSYVGDGSYTFSGAGICVLGFAHIGNGQFVYSGSASYSYGSGTNYEYIGDGQIIWTGAALQNYTINLSYVGDGSFVYSGGALYSLGFSYIGNGEFIYSGSALYSYKPDFIYIGNGTYVMSGAGDYKIELTYIGNGQFIFSGAADCNYTIAGVYEYIGNGVFVYSGHTDNWYGTLGKRSRITILRGGNQNS